MGWCAISKSPGNWRTKAPMIFMSGLPLFALTKIPICKEGYNSHYVAAVLINHRVSENSPLQDLSFAKPQKAAGILAKIRAAQLQHTVAPFADAAAVSASSSAIASNSAVSRRGHNAGAGVCSPKPEPGAEQNRNRQGTCFPA